MKDCNLPPKGWKCSREAGHDGPCAASPAALDGSKPGPFKALLIRVIGWATRMILGALETVRDAVAWAKSCKPLMVSFRFLVSCVLFTGNQIRAAFAWVFSWAYDALQFLVLLAFSAAFYFSAGAIQSLDPTAGTFDLGYLQTPLVAAAWLSFGTAVAWLALRFSFPDANRWVDAKDGFSKAWDGLSDPARLILAVVLFFALLAAYLVCLALVPV